MTLEEAKQAAESGQVQAMTALGNYYYEQKKVWDACDWFDRAAEAEDPYGVEMSMHINCIIAVTLEAMGQWEDAAARWDTASRRSRLILSRPERFSDTAAPEAREMAAKSTYGLGLDLLRLGRPRDAMAILRRATETDPKCRFLYGMCLAESEPEDMLTALRGAYPYLAAAETGELKVEDDLLFRGLMYLALIYRKAGVVNIPGVKTDVERALECVSLAAALPGELGEKAREEERRYHKGLFGYTYKE